MFSQYASANMELVMNLCPDILTVWGLLPDTSYTSVCLCDTADSSSGPPLWALSAVCGVRVTDAGPPDPIPHDGEWQKQNFFQSKQLWLPQKQVMAWRTVVVGGGTRKEV